MTLIIIDSADRVRSSKRPRSHRLETESRRAFERVLPSAWVVRDISDDYGVDVEVEIFDGDDATGEQIKVQLKGTDAKPNRAGSFSVSVDVEKLAYWRRLDTPVLVVLYTATDGAVYARWAQSYDPYPSRHIEAKTASFKFSAKDRLNPTLSPEKLRRELGIIRALRNKEMPYQVGVTLNLSSPHKGVRAEDIEAHLRMAFYRSGGALAVRSEGEADAYLAIDKRTIRLAFIGDVASFNVHLEDNIYAAPNAVQRICADAMMAIAMFLFNEGKTDVATDVALRYLDSSQISKSWEGLDFVYQELMLGGRLADGWRIVKPFLESNIGTRITPPDFWLTQIIFHEGFRRLPRAEKDDIVQTMERLAEARESSGVGSAGVLFYSAGQVCEAYGRIEKALQLFVRAADVDSRYLSRGYYHREIATLYFVAGDYDSAADHYRKAMDTGGPAEASYLLSNSLMHAGNFKDAASVSVDVESVPRFYQAGARIQDVVLRRVRETLSLDNQKRSPVSSDDLPDSPRDLGADDAIALMQSSDALDHRLWFANALNQDEESDALESMLVASYVAQDSPDLWVSALYLAIVAEKDGQYREDICRLAFQGCSGASLLEVIDRLDSGGRMNMAQTREEVLRFIELPRLKSPRVVRFHNQDGTTSVHNVDNEEDRLWLGAAKYVSGLSEDRLKGLAKKAIKGR